MVEQFKDFLDEEEIFYKHDEFDDGKNVFRIPQRLKTGGVVDMLVVFDEDDIKLLIMKIGTVEDPEKKAE